MKMHRFLEQNPVIFNNKNFTKAVEKVFGNDLVDHSVKFIDKKLVITYRDKNEGCLVFNLVQNDGTHLTDFHAETVGNCIQTVRRKESSYITVRLCYSHNHRESPDNPFQLQILPTDSKYGVFRAALNSIFSLHLHMKDYTETRNKMNREFDKLKKYTSQ